MSGTLAWLLFTALYCYAVQRWVGDFRRHAEPWLRRKLRIEPGAGRAPVLAVWLPVLVTAFVVFAPVAGLFLAAHFRLIPWYRAGMLLGLTLMISCIAWLLQSDGRRTH
jgi:hypothetical protein